MHCEQCSNRVIRRLNELDGVAAKVNLGKKRLFLTKKKSVMR
ncbi:MAG: cation transporter [Lachnospiraceae bacterium]|nr:cation transporter [Lachnospiraceae bacterium]